MRSGASTTTFALAPAQGLKAFARRQVGRLVGTAMLAGACVALAALATWNVADPSFSHATDNAVTNAMGFAGAIFADIAMQFYGLAAVALLVPVVVWGLLLCTARGVTRLPRRAIAWALASVLGAAVAGCFTAPPTWPLPTGLGGVFGDMALKLPALFIGAYPEGLLAKGIALLFALPALVFYLYGAGLILRPNGFARQPEDEMEDEPFVEADEEDGGEGLLALGAITHWWLSARSFTRRQMSRLAPRERDDAFAPAESGWRRAAVRVEMAERNEQRVDPQSRARVEPQFFAALVADKRNLQERREPSMEMAAPHAGDMFAEPEQPYADAATVEDDFYGDEPFPFEQAQDMPLVDAAAGRRVAPVHEEVHEDPPMQAFGEPEWRPAPASAVGPNTRVQAYRSPAGEASKLRIDPAPPIPEPIVPEPACMPEAAPAHTAAAPMAAPMAAAPAPARAAPAAATPAARIQTARVGRSVGEDVFQMPALSFLAEPKSVARDASMSKDALEQNARILEGVLDDFGVKGEIINVRPGPVVTLYELEPAPGIKSSRVIGLADDIARSMSAIACRVAVVPGRNAIGIELPNAKRETVYLRELLASRDFAETKASLALALGKTINGEAVIADIAKMPHVLVAGTTGSGKSVAINTMILSLLYRMTPKQCRLIMVDPKMVELSVYDGIPHLLTPVVTDPKKAVVALKWTVREMEDRYRKMAKLGVRNAEGFNARVAQAAGRGERISRTVQTGFDRETGEAIYETEELDLEPMPFIVVIIDEVADLMMVAGKDIEGAVQRLGQMARAAGIHVIMATQRPSVDVITGTIKANFPTRMSFQVTSKIDSRTILGEQGAEQLLGMGDMLFMAGGGRIQRVHGPFVSDNEVEKVVAHLKLQGVPEYLDAIVQDDEDEDEDTPAGRGGGSSMGGDSFEESDDPYDQAVAVVLRDGKASTSYIQRRLGIGYNRAASIIERMEKDGIVGPANHAGKREILVPTEEDKM